MEVTSQPPLRPATPNQTATPALNFHLPQTSHGIARGGHPNIHMVSPEGHPMPGPPLPYPQIGPCPSLGRPFWGRWPQGQSLASTPCPPPIIARPKTWGPLAPQGILRVGDHSLGLSHQTQARGRPGSRGAQHLRVESLAPQHPGPPSQTTQACSAQSHSSVTTPRVAPAPAPWGKAPLEHDSAVPSMAASLSAQGFSHTHAYCPLRPSFLGDQPSPDTPPCPARTPGDRREGGQSAPKGI